MGHIGHEHRLQTSRIISPFCFLLQPFLLLDEVVDVSYDTVCAQHLTVLVEVGHAVDEVPLHLIAFVEERVHFREIGALHAEVGIVIHQPLTERTVNEVLYQLIETHCVDFGSHSFIEGTGALGP